MNLWMGPGRHCVCYPVSSGKLVNFGATAPAADWHRESWTAQGDVADLVTAYAGWSPRLRELFEAADTVSRWAIHDRTPLTSWARDRIVLLGDAAHPMLPFLAQGANQAIEDAACLAACLADPGLADVDAALAHYQHLRIPRVARIQEVSTANTELFHLPDGSDQRARDAQLAAGTPDGYDWIYRHDATKIN
ncbi:FAD-dependent monooxygenase [Nocardia asiatica]|uniref:FAD-dependent monooxygenase n=1 Tax=Nocardia asiatica TaxID=209252 RepID=UPI003EE19D18